MLTEINSIRKNYTFLNMRIGIHTGKKIIGGILGTKVVRYDAYGRDMLIANKMESSGEAGKVMISQSTKQWIDKESNNLFTIEKAKKVRVEGYDGSSEIIQTYFIS